MTTSKKTATKSPAKRRVTAKPKAKATARKATSAKAFVHWAEGFSPYADIVDPVRSTLIVAALIASGFAKLNAKGELSKAPSGNAKLFREIVGPTPYNYHRKASRISGDALTAAGIVWFQRRLKSEDHVKLARSMATAMAKGGKVGELNFKRTVTVEA